MAGKNVAVKQQADSVRAALDRMKPQLLMALPKHITPERLLRVTMTSVQNNPKLLECDRTSLFAAVMTCAQLGLEPDGVLGQAYLVPFKSGGGMKVQFIPGYKGYLTLARQSGEISSIQAHEVCKNDEFSYSYGLEEHLHHVPAEGDRGDVTHFYAYAKFKDGGHIFEVMTVNEVNAIRDNSEGYKAFKKGFIKSTPWDSHYIQMGRKTGIRRLANYLPMSVQRAAAMDAAYDEGKHGHTDDYGDVVIDGESETVEQEEGTGESKAASKLDSLAGEEEQQDPQPEKEKPASSKKASAAKDKPPFKAPAGTHWEDTELVDDETGEIVTEEYDAKGRPVKGNDSEPEPTETEEAGNTGLFPDED